MKNVRLQYSVFPIKWYKVVHSIKDKIRERTKSITYVRVFIFSSNLIFSYKYLPIINIGNAKNKKYNGTFPEKIVSLILSNVGLLKIKWISSKKIPISKNIIVITLFALLKISGINLSPKYQSRTAKKVALKYHRW